jgi:PEP-CTERM motif
MTRQFTKQHPPALQAPRVLLSLLAALSCASAHAGNSQASVNPPGGFTSACATEVSSGGAYLPGRDLVASFSGWVGRHSCQTAVFEGASGQSAASAQWTAPGVQNASAIQAGMGFIQLQASNSAPRSVQFPGSAAGGGWSESMVVDVAGHTGQAGTWLFSVDVSGMLATSTGLARVYMSAFKNEEELWKDVPGFDKGGSDPLGTDRQRVVWEVGGDGSRDIVDEVTFAVPVTLGQSFVWGIYATASASTASYQPGSGLMTSAVIDFSHTLRYGGSTGVLIGGVLYDNESLVSTSGIDWQQATPVPEPTTWALMLAGAGVLGSVLRRRTT